MSANLELIRERAARYASAIGPGGEKAWLAGQLAADVPGLLLALSDLIAETEEVAAELADERTLHEKTIAQRDAAKEVADRLAETLREALALWRQIPDAPPEIDATLCRHPRGGELARWRAVLAEHDGRRGR